MRVGSKNKKQILFIHQNFPGQYRYLAKYYAELNDWDVYAVGEKACVQRQLHSIPKNITLLGYVIPKALPKQVSPRVESMAGYVARADVLESLLLRQKAEGLDPDIILAHPGWGEGLYLKEIFPRARLVYFFEFYFSTTQYNINFDPDFPSTLNQQISYRMSNTATLVSLDVADVGISPTQWQFSTHPKAFQSKIKVIHDGVDTSIVKPRQPVDIVFSHLPAGEITLSPDDEIITYSVRNLEPSRGFHRYMRALPDLQKARPKARFIIIGGDEKSYSGAHASGKSWREVMLEEVGGRLDMGRVVFLGKIPYERLLDLFSMTALHIYMTTPFVLSWSLMEAMACEAPVLASSTEPVIEVIEDGENGFLFDYFSQKELIEKVSLLMENPELRKNVSKKARQTVVERYDLHTVCLPQHIALIDEQLKLMNI
jgi:glycosyltransferase involved in cell wall biosynthesis